MCTPYHPRSRKREEVYWVSNRRSKNSENKIKFHRPSRVDVVCASSGYSIMNVLVCTIPELGRSRASLRMLLALSSSSFVLEVIHAVVSPRFLSPPAEIAFMVLCTLSRSMSSVFCDLPRPPIQVKFPVFLMMKTRRLGRDAAMMTDAGSTTFQIARSTLESFHATISPNVRMYHAGI